MWSCPCAHVCSLLFEIQLQDTVLAVSDLRQRFTGRDQSDFPFDQISHVVTSVCYLLGTILKIKYAVNDPFTTGNCI